VPRAPVVNRPRSEPVRRADQDRDGLIVGLDQTLFQSARTDAIDPNLSSAVSI